MDGKTVYSLIGSFRKNFIEGDDLVDAIATDHSHTGFGGRAVISEKGKPSILITASPTCNLERAKQTGRATAITSGSRIHTRTLKLTLNTSLRKAATAASISTSPTERKPWDRSSKCRSETPPANQI